MTKIIYFCKLFVVLLLIISVNTAVTKASDNSSQYKCVSKSGSLIYVSNPTTNSTEWSCTKANLPLIGKYDPEKVIASRPSMKSSLGQNKENPIDVIAKNTSASKIFDKPNSFIISEKEHAELKKALANKSSDKGDDPKFNLLNGMDIEDLGDYSKLIENFTEKFSNSSKSN